jgi:hypothetical protein
VVALTFIRCELATETLTPGPGVHAVRWWKIEEIDLDQVLAADRQFLARWGARPR